MPRSVSLFRGRFSICTQSATATMQLLIVVSAICALGYVTGQAVDTSTAAVQQAIVDQHNSLRRAKPSKMMYRISWDADTASRAQAWADRCVYAHPSTDAEKNTYLKTSRYRLGQNIAQGSGSTPWTWSSMINMWYNEVNSFTMDQATSATVGHYTQVVWNATFWIGCGYKNCGSFHYYVCDYAPAGNVQPGEYSPYEPGTACSKCPTACDNGLCTNPVIATPCAYEDQYSNCAVASQGSAALFPNGCTNSPAYLDSYKQYCQRTCNCGTGSSNPNPGNPTTATASPTPAPASCAYTDYYSNCGKADGGYAALFPNGCSNVPSYLAGYVQYCQATCNCGPAFG